MDVGLLSRIQFGLTIGFHYIYPPVSIGLGLILVIMEGMYLKTGDKLYEQLTRFWVKIFALIFALGVATGIVMEFQFGMNWSVYSRYVGDVFGSALAAEGILAFFLESTFLGILVFGWNRVKPRTHFISTIMVALGAHLSAIWIVVANSWQQTPAGHHIVDFGDGVRAEIVDFWQVVFNPSFLDRISHVYMGAWQAGAFLVVSVSAYYLLKGKHLEFAKKAMAIGLAIALFSSLGQLATGHSSAHTLAETQPAKLAALEGHYPASQPAGLYILGWVNEEKQETYGIKIPGLLSFMVHWDFDEPVTGLEAFPEDERPPVNIVFQSYHLMVATGFCLIFLSFLSVFALWKGFLTKSALLLKILIASVLLPQIANQAGWMSAEIGRQPWVVYGLLKTSEAYSPSVSAGEVLASIIIFSLVYLMMFGLFIFILFDKITKGPVTDSPGGKAGLS